MNSNKISCQKYVSSNSSPILELSVKFASQICHENINKPLDGAYLADFGIDINPRCRWFDNGLHRCRWCLQFDWRTNKIDFHRYGNFSVELSDEGCKNIFFLKNQHNREILLFLNQKNWRAVNNWAHLYWIKWLKL